nr:Zinc-type alcohol dehydrogenase-like protein C2E1P3.01-like protein 4 [Colletotrichum truncatum]KAF6787942.1 Zinc-type alcohol dehydrogenase-like protein C2E1P3.01-like protein 4 [Colletotrichum truncatum]
MQNSKKTMAMVTGPGPSLEYKEINTPKPGSGQMLVEVQYAAQNPTDVQSYDIFMFGDGAVLGCDFVGKIIELGESVTKYNVGDLVASTVWGGETKGIGAFATHTLADEKISFRVSDISEASAATIPLAACTAWLALFSERCLNIDRSRKESVLIWGGSCKLPNR